MIRLVLAMVLFTAAFSASGATATVSLERDTIVVGETGRLFLRVEGGNLQSVPDFPAIPNLSIQFSGQQQREWRNEAGRMSQSIALVYFVTPSQPGTHNIPAIRVTVDGASVATQPVRLTATANASGNGAAQPPAFVRLNASKTNAYVGELIPIEVKAYGLIDELNYPTLKSDGFTIAGQGQAMRGHEQVGNEMLNMFSFPLTVVGAKAGNLTLGPAEVQMIYRLQAPRRRGGDPFDQLFGGGYQRKQGTIPSEGVPVKILPLPTNAPAGFNGAVGNFTMSVTAGATNVAEGDPITLLIRIQGRGAMELVQLPNFKWRDFTFYPPLAQTTNTDATGVNTLKIFEQVVVPQRAGITAIPAIEFSFFDPAQHAYRTVKQPPIPITVRGSGAAIAQPTVATGAAPAENENTPAARDIVHIKPSLGPIVATANPTASTPVILVLQLLPFGLFAAVVAWSRKQERLANDPKARRAREVEKNFATTLPELRRLASGNQQEQFFAGVFRTLQEVLGERLDVPSSAITEAIVDDKLPKLGANAALISQVDELFAICNQARYAGVSVAGMEAVIPKLETAVAQIRQLGGKV